MNQSIQSFLTPFTLQAKDKSGRKAIAEHTPSVAWARSSWVTRFGLLTSSSAGSTRAAWTANLAYHDLPGSFGLHQYVPELQKRPLPHRYEGQHPA